MNKILPFFWPTKMIIVDDNELFVESLTEHINNKHRCKAFTNPLDALYELQSEEFNFDWFISKKGFSGFGAVDYNINYQTIESITNNSNRYNIYSTLVIDNDMPEMKGLDFCKKIPSNLGIRRIMLTGNLGYKSGVKELNHKIVDSFVAKDDLSGTIINNLISKEERVFFDNHSKKIFYFLKMENSLNPIFQEDYKNYFNQVIEKHQICEYYMLNDQGWFLLINENGKKHVLYLYNEAELDEICKEAEYRGLKQDFLSQLKSRHKGFCFYRVENDEWPDDIRDWQQYFCDLMPITINSKKHFVAIGPYQI